MKAGPWFRFDNAGVDPSTVDIQIIDFIGDWLDDYFGFGVTAKAFVDQLAKLPDAVSTIRVHINSPGGDVFGAVNIANALRDQQVSKGRAVETIVEGLAASAASIIMMAGKTVRIADNALVMVHNPWSVAVGNAADMRKQADTLDTLRNTIVATYQWQSTLSAEALVALMDAETWMDADEAIANGFATDKIQGLQAAASLNAGAVAKLTIPDKYRDRVHALLKPAPTAPVAAAATEVLRLCREHACLDLAESLIVAKSSLEEVQARVAAARTTRTQATERATQIRALCETARLPELAAGYLNGAMSLEDIRAHLTTITAKVAGAEIDGSLEPDRGSRRTPVIDVAATYAARNPRAMKKE
jgi:ATP-dependent protease ClpP protease subunit